LRLSSKRVFLHVVKRKSLCNEDGRIRVDKIDWIRGRFTRRFAEQVNRLTSITTNAEAGWFLDLDDETVYRIDRSILEELVAERLEPIETPLLMSVDEVAWQKWHRYVTNVVDIEKHKVIWNHDGRGKDVLNRFYKALGEQQCKQIKAVASDGAQGYIASTKENAAQALIVLDHFHVKKYLNDAVDAVRKQELRKARDRNDMELSGMLHCNKRFILMQTKVTNKKRDMLEILSKLNQSVYQAMLLKEQFLCIYTSADRKKAWANLKNWIVTALQSDIPEFVKLAKKFFRKRHYVLNYFIYKIVQLSLRELITKLKDLKDLKEWLMVIEMCNIFY